VRGRERGKEKRRRGSKEREREVETGSLKLLATCIVFVCLFVSINCSQLVKPK
jgi:hypothetical protein